MTGIMQVMLGGSFAPGNVYYIGIISGGTSYNFGIASNATMMVMGNQYFVSPNYRFLILKYDHSGILTWQKQLYTSAGSYLTGVKISSSSDVYVCGYDLNGGVARMIIAKYNSSNVLQWQRRFYDTGGGQTVSYSLAIDSSNNIYGCGDSINSTFGYSQIQLVKYDSSGSLVWQKSLSYSGYSIYGLSTNVSVSNIIYSCGRYYNAKNYGQIIAVNSSGTLQWQRQLSSASTSVQCACIASDSNDNAYIGSKVGGGTSNLACYNSSGTLLWQRDLNVVVNAIAVDSSNNIYLCGTITVSTRDAVFIAKYNSSGVIQWQRSISTSGYITGASISVTGTDIYVGVNNSSFAKLPTSGALTGAYTLSGVVYTYASSSATDSTGTLTNATTSHSFDPTSFTSGTSTLTDSTPTLTSTIATIP